MNDIPIIIPVKFVCIRCPYKNYFLLPFTLNYLKSEDRKNVWVVSDSEELLKIAEDYGVGSFLEIRSDSYLI